MLVETVGYTFAPVIADPTAVAGLNIPSRGGPAPRVLRWLIWASGRRAGTRVRIVCPEKTAAAATSRFLQLSAPGYRSPKRGTRILTEGKPGLIYVGGVRVSTQANLLFSYDFSLIEAKTAQNRDRTIVDGYALSRLISGALAECEDKAVFAALIKRAQTGKLAEAEAGFANQVTRATQKRLLLELGAELFGGAVYFADINSDEAALDLADRGYQPVAFTGLAQWTGSRLASLLGLRSASQIVARREQKREQVVWTKPSAITAAERANLEAQIGLVRAVFGSTALGVVKVYESAKLESGECFEAHGFYSPTGAGDVAIRHDQLSNPVGLLETLVHEAGHRLGHRQAARFGMTWPEYTDRSRGFEHVLGVLAASAAKMLHDGVRPEAVAATAAAIEAAGLAVAADPLAAGLEPAAPGFAWVVRVNGAYRYFDLITDPAVTFAAAFSAKVHAAGQAAGLPPVRHPGAYAKAAFVSSSQVTRLMIGQSLGLSFARWIDVCAPSGLNPGAAWWAMVGAEETLKRVKRRSTKMGGTTGQWAEDALASLATLGPEAEQIAARLRGYIDGTRRPETSNAYWLAPIARAVELAIAASPVTPAA